MLRQEMEEDPDDPWVLYLYAWTANRLEMPESALGPALDAWNLEPSNQWYLAECLKAMRETGMLQEMMELSRYVRGGGVCRYYLADAEIRLGMESSPSLAYLLEAIASRDDSTAADACAWLCILLGDDVDDDSTVSLATKAVELAPGEEFYRCLLAEKLAETGNVEDSRVQIHHMRLGGYAGYSYWKAVAALAEAEDDVERRIWALTRARECRTCPEADRDLGWTLYFAGRNALREGDIQQSRIRLEAALLLGDSTEVFRQRADSIMGLIVEFQGSAP